MSTSARLRVVLLGNLALVGALVGVGAAAHSISTWAEGADYLGDAAAIGVTILAMRLEAPTTRRPGGLPKATSFAALITATWLEVLALLVIAGSADRLATGVHRVQGMPMLAVSAVAAVTMAAGALVLGGEAGAGGSGGGLGVRAVLLDTVADAAAAAGVAAAGGAIAATGGNYWLDPAVALAIGVAVAVAALRLVVRALADLRS